MADINLITAPDRLLNNATSFLLIYPNADTKTQFSNLLESIDKTFNVYLYEASDDAHTPDWLLTTAKIVDYVVLDIDNCPPEVRELSSYFIANNNTYWLTKGENMFYNIVSNKRIYTLDYFIDKIGDPFEEQTQ
jgi:hypothetical protein